MMYIVSWDYGLPGIGLSDGDLTTRGLLDTLFLLPDL